MIWFPRLIQLTPYSLGLICDSGRTPFYPLSSLSISLSPEPQDLKYYPSFGIWFVNWSWQKTVRITWSQLLHCLVQWKHSLNVCCVIFFKEKSLFEISHGVEVRSEPHPDASTDNLKWIGKLHFQFNCHLSKKSCNGHPAQRNSLLLTVFSILRVAK